MAKVILPKFLAKFLARLTKFIGLVCLLLFLTFSRIVYLFFIAPEAGVDAETVENKIILLFHSHHRPWFSTSRYIKKCVSAFRNYDPNPETS